MKRFFSILMLALVSACAGGGYSFTGADAGNAKTVSISFFDNYADLIKPQLSQTFTEKLRDIFVQQTSLELVSNGGDLEFEGSITGYTIEPINAQANQQATVAQNRLTIEVNVIFTNNLKPEDSFEQRFNRYDDFPANQDIGAVEAELHDKLSQELSENILNRSIGNW